MYMAMWIVLPISSIGNLFSFFGIIYPFLTYGIFLDEGSFWSDIETVINKYNYLF